MKLVYAGGYILKPLHCQCLTPDNSQRNTPCFMLSQTAHLGYLTGMFMADARHCCMKRLMAKIAITLTLAPHGSTPTIGNRVAAALYPVTSSYSGDNLFPRRAGQEQHPPVLSCLIVPGAPE